MRSIGLQGEGLQRNLRFAVFLRALAPVVLLTGILAGCAAPTHYMGIDISQPAPAFALSPEQIAFFQEQNLLFAKAQAAGCIPTEPDGKAADVPIGEDVPGSNADQRAACHAIAEQLATLETRRPALAFKRSYADMPLTALASEAQRGSKQAQLELGIRFEEGKGVERDLQKARRLYTLAASDVPGQQIMFIPNNGVVNAVTVSTGKSKMSGLNGARARLLHLKTQSLQSCLVLQKKQRSPTECKGIDDDPFGRALFGILKNYDKCRGDLIERGLQISRLTTQELDLFLSCLRIEEATDKDLNLRNDRVIQHIYYRLRVDSMEAKIAERYRGAFQSESQLIVSAFKNGPAGGGITDIISYIFFARDIFSGGDFQAVLPRDSNLWFEICSRFGKRIEFVAQSSSATGYDLLINQICSTNPRISPNYGEFMISRKTLWEGGL